MNRLDSTGLSHLIGRLTEYMYSFAVETGPITALPKVITDERITGSHVVENEYVFSDLDLGWVTTDGKLILYGDLDDSKPSVKLYLRKVAGLEPDPVAVDIRVAISSSVNGNYIYGDGRNLIPGTQYTWRLYRVVDGGEDEYVGGVSATVPEPRWSMYFQEVANSLEDGEHYYVTLKTTSGTEAPAVSPVITFTGGTGVGT